VQQIFVVSTESRRAFGPIQLPVQWETGNVTVRVKRPGPATTATAKVKNEWIYTSTAPDALMARAGTVPYPYTRHYMK
jgi:vancomycin resistance protein YoaR